MDYRTLAQELKDDPLGREYAKMDVEAAAADLNAPTVTVPRGVVPSHEVVNVLIAGDRNKIDPTDLTWLLLVLAPGTVDVGNERVQSLLISILAASTGSKDGIVELANTTVSRAEQLGLGVVSPGDVKLALGGKW